MQRVFHRHIQLSPSAPLTGGVGAEATATTTQSSGGIQKAVGYAAGLVFLGGGLYAGLKGSFLIGGIAVILSPIIASVVGNYGSSYSPV